MSRSRADKALKLFCLGCSVAAFGLLAGICYFLFNEAWQGVAAIGLPRFFTDRSWYPQASGNGTFGLLPMLAASLLLGLCSAALAAPLAIALVIFYRFYAPRVIAQAARTFVEVLGAVPSVVYGLLGLTMLVPAINLIAPPGTSLLAGILVLVPMILPTIAILFDAGLERVSRELVASAAALGLSRAALIIKVVMPVMVPTIISSCVLALARALGETMAVMMVTGNVIQLPGSLFDPVRALPANIALEMPYALGAHRSSLFVCGLLMVLFTVLLLLLARAVRLSRGGFRA